VGGYVVNVIVVPQEGRNLHKARIRKRKLFVNTLSDQRRNRAAALATRPTGAFPFLIRELTLPPCPGIGLAKAGRSGLQIDPLA
jgi:hypothetical protein